MVYISAVFLFFFSLFLFVLPSKATDKTNAPLSSVDLRVIVVSLDGSGDYTSIQSAVDVAEPGDTIQVRTGVYKESVWITKSGTPDKPITLMAYPGDVPTIDPTGTGHGGNASPDQNGIYISKGAKWWIIDGFEIKGGYNGVKIGPGGSSNITIRNNYVHDSNYQGILIVNANDILIANNEIHSNGIDGDECFFNLSSGYVNTPSKCHGIYMSNFDQTGVQRITIRGNYIHTQGGAGIQTYDSASEVLIENNLLVNTSHGMWLGGIQNSVVRNNTLVLISPVAIKPTDQSQYYSVIDSRWGNKTTLAGNVVKNNIVYVSQSSFNGFPVYVLAMPDVDSSTWSVNYNLWYAPSNTKWIWKNTVKTDFNSEYKQTTGWDKNGPSIPSDPMFVDLSQHNYSIRSSSPAIDNGDPTSASKLDLTRKPRDSKPDIGAYEY
ncbi:MAG: hypothetical protein KatS3mg078_1292 [Deltaproteobacteria bacterium]|nr:MAG: hypothetical protein KatS3mg078_1292 [Deltaproteobacteria bacterium]